MIQSSYRKVNVLITGNQMQIFLFHLSTKRIYYSEPGHWSQDIKVLTEWVS